ncbi:MAG: DUF481 domain-containing protein [Verrucomicrobia bacterium]|nr:DUF481 domain-containing protein [Verrucomicrobiota bacterium]
MKSARFFLRILAALLAAGVSSIRADVVETKNGARLVGTVTKIDSANVTLDTAYAGVLTIKQSEVTGVQTESPRFVRLSDGTVLKGAVVPAGGGNIGVKAEGGTTIAPMTKVVTTWTPGTPDPAVVALKRKWSFEASLDVTGKTGNNEQLGTAASFRSKLTGPIDTLQLYTAYNRQETNNVKSADQFKAGADYSDNFYGRYSWYVRDEGGFDHVKDIHVYNVSATGFGYDFIKKPLHIFTGRAGFSYRYENYSNPETDDVQSLGLDVGLNHEYTFRGSKLVNRLSYDPSFSDFTNFHFTHESYYEVPLFNPAWKLRLGITHDYSSRPGAGVDRLDTTYFTRLVLNWQ